jgi:hypothetical protein
MIYQEKRSIFIIAKRKEKKNPFLEGTIGGRPKKGEGMKASRARK